MRLFYTLLFYIALPFIYLRLLWRSRRLPAYRERMVERLGLINVPDAFEKAIWIHAVSFGEVVVTTPLVKRLCEIYPDIPIVMTSMTPTGAAQIKKIFADDILHCYAPYDLPGCVNRFLNKVQPRLAIFIETELWPNYLHLLNQRNIPSLLANARLSEKSAKGYGHFAGLVGEMLDNLSLLAIQAKADADRFTQLGASTDKITITGNIKFDVQVPNGLLGKAKILRKQLGNDRLVWIAGSTHEGEEEQVLNAFSEVKKQFPQALLLLVPRHPDRFEKVITLCKDKHFNIVLRGDKIPCDTKTDVFVGNTMGEMLLFYAAADVAFIGGSLISNGGHNMLEPALFAKPIIIGASMFNFAQISKLLIDAKAMMVVNDHQELADVVVDFFKDQGKAETYGRHALAVVEDNRGALTMHLKLIEKLLPA